MISLIRKRLELKIILALAFVIVCTVGGYTYFDIRHIRTDTIRTSERTLGAFAAAIKGSVDASMKKGRHEAVRHMLEEVNSPYFMDRVMIYDERGRPLNGLEKLTSDSGLDMNIPPVVLKSVVKGDLSDVHEQGGNYFISYYSPIENRRECFRCHGRQAKLNGILRIDFSLRELNDLIVSRRTRVFAWSAILIVILIAALMALLRVVVYRPVKELRDAMAKAKKGTDPLILSTEGTDELADLKKNFVSMLHRINALHRTNLEKEKELAHNQEIMRFRAELQVMFDAMPDGVLLIDPDLRIIQSNPRAYELLPPLKEINGQIPLDRTQESCPHFGLRKAFREGVLSEHQCSVKFPNGGERHVYTICAPIIEDGRVAYVVEVIRDMTERIKMERELEERTSELLSANKLLSQIAITDSLTQVFNRRHFDEVLYKEIKRYNRRKYSSLSLMMIDIDHFKTLNDTYGHLVGDAVLRELSTLLKEDVRETDTIARYGGEEFVIVMPDTRLDGAVFKAEMLRKKVQAREFPGHDAPVHITISIGVAEYGAGLPHDLIHAVDTALYQAKNAGRDTVAVSRREGKEVET